MSGVDIYTSSGKQNGDILMVAGSDADLANLPQE
jgi:hypothetical protein